MHSGQLLRAAEAAEALDAALMQEGELQHALLFAALYQHSTALLFAYVVCWSCRVEVQHTLLCSTVDGW